MNKFLFFLLALVMVTACKKDKKTDSPEANNDFLSEVTYNKLVIEICYAPGMEPSKTAVDGLANFLQERLHKSDGIEIVRKLINPPAKSVYSFDELKQLENTYRTVQTSGSTIGAYIFCAGGEYDQNSGSSKVLGIAYGSSSIVLFEKTIQDISGGLTQPSRSSVENSVLDHEFAHLLGLVNNGTNMVEGHQDEAHGKHCNNTKCLMYYAAETSDLIGNLLNGAVPALDENCLKDLRANGGK